MGHVVYFLFEWKSHSINQIQSRLFKVQKNSASSRKFYNQKIKKIIFYNNNKCLSKLFLLELLVRKSVRTTSQVRLQFCGKIKLLLVNNFSELFLLFRRLYLSNRIIVVAIVKEEYKSWRWNSWEKFNVVRSAVLMLYNYVSMVHVTKGSNL